MTLRILLFISALLISSNYGCDVNCGGNNREAWFGQGIVPFIINNIPVTVVEVTFQNDAVAETAQFLTVEQIASQPKSIEYSFNSSGLYTIVMFDPDSPSQNSPTDAQYIQWLVTNVNGQDAINNNLNAGDVLYPYETPLPATNTGTHSYLILVFLQSDRLNIQPPSQRQHFDVETFASQNGLGSAVAGVFFYVRTDV